jgi:hypothetical protein
LPLFLARFRQKQRRKHNLNNALNSSSGCIKLVFSAKTKGELCHELKI